MPLQRVMTDFGSENAFAKAAKKIKEHYGIIVPISSERNITMDHAQAIKHKLKKEVLNKNKRASKKDMAQRAGSAFIISETDGSMVPIVVTKNSGKNKAVMYREARLTLAHEHGSNTPVFSATFDDVDTVGKHIRYCIDKAGCGSNSQIHAIGDGALWIADQMDKQFGSQATYLIDFYHASEYLGEASYECAKTTPIKWLHSQQQLLRCGHYKTVLNNLKEYAMVEGSAAYKCYQYLRKRVHQLHYDKAIKNDLPIGSGEIESAHRYIIQHRIKIPGAWWLIDNAESIIYLSIHRAHNNWDDYWQNVKTA